MRHVRRATGWIATIAALIASVAVTTASIPPALAAPPDSAAYTAITPTRIVDTRTSARLTGGQTLTVQVESVTSGVPADATAVVFNLLALNAGPGYVTAYPAHLSRPDTSSLNIVNNRQMVNNLVTLPLSPTGAVKIYSSVSTHLVVDVQGYFTPSGATVAGRLTPVPPVRLLDTRIANPVKFGKLAPDSTVTVPIAQRGGFPTDAVAAVLNVTVTNSTKLGYWSIFPSGGAPTSSNINPDAANQTIANQVITRLSSGDLQVYTSGGGHLIIDLVGWFTGPSAASVEDGLFVPLSPERLVDTRTLGVTKPARNRTMQVAVANRAGMPATGIGAVLLNATTTQTSTLGYFTIWPAQTYRLLASNLNAMGANQTLANHAVTPVSDGGFAMYTSNGGHLIADVAGWFTGTEHVSELPAAVPLVGTSGPPAHSSYEFESGSPPPDRWDPCRGAIRYRLNLGPYGSEFAPMIQEALERAEAMTGLTFTYVGTSTFWPQMSNPTPFTETDISYKRTMSHDVLIALGNESLSDFVDGAVAGRAYYFSSSNSFSGPMAISQASIVIDMADVAGEPDYSTVGPGAVLLHELGHALGLGHVGDDTQLMYPIMGAGPSYQLGDLNGLWRLRAGLGCVLTGAYSASAASDEPPSVRIVTTP